MKNYLLKTIAAVAVLSVLLIAVAGCAGNGGENKNDDSLQKVLDAGQLILGLDAGFPPMGFTDGSGQIVGFDIDVAEEVCKRLGVRLVKQSIDWDEKEDDLNSGKIDCIWNGMSVTPARSETMNLSDPYMKNEVICVVSGESDIKGLRDLKGKTIGVQSGSTAQEALETSSFYSEVTVKLFDDNIALLNQLDQKTVEVAIVDSVVAYYFISSSEKKFFVLPDSLAEEQYAIGFRKGDHKLRDKVQQILGEMKADGTLGRISKMWFSSDITTVR